MIKAQIDEFIDYLSFAISSSFCGLFLKYDIIVATSPQFFTTNIVSESSKESSALAVSLETITEFDKKSFWVIK